MRYYTQFMESFIREILVLIISIYFEYLLQACD